MPQSGKLTKIDFTTANLATLKTVVSTLTTAQITGIRTGLLGGVDHSIPAIIGPSQIPGSPTRPTIAYFGALDGMLHAVLVSGTYAGKSPGDEVWAFIPPSQLAKTVAQTGGVDGSPSVGDAFIDPTGNGTKSWRTLLAVPDGTYAGGTLDVLDITDPTQPEVLWTASDSITSGGKTYVLGRAQGAAISPLITSSGAVKFAYFIVTDNTNGSWGNGFNMYALDATDGSVIWRYNHTYANDTTHNDVPGTIAAVDDTGGGGPADKVYFGDLEGKVWQVKAIDGSPPPRSSTPPRPTCRPTRSTIRSRAASCSIAIRPTTHLDLVGVTSGADWVPAATLSRVFKIDLGATPTPTSTTLTTLGSGRARLRGADRLRQQHLLHHQHRQPAERHRQLVHRHRQPHAHRHRQHAVGDDAGDGATGRQRGRGRRQRQRHRRVGDRHHAERQRRRRQIAVPLSLQNNPSKPGARPRLARPALSRAHSRRQRAISHAINTINTTASTANA